MLSSFMQVYMNPSEKLKGDLIIFHEFYRKRAGRQGGHMQFCRKLSQPGIESYREARDKL